MAFRASTKTKKTSPLPEPVSAPSERLGTGAEEPLEDQSKASAGFTIDDLIGGGEEKEQTANSKEQTANKEEIEPKAVEADPAPAETPYRRPQAFDRGRGFSRPGFGQSRSDRGQRPGQARLPELRSGVSGQGYRREWGRPAPDRPAPQGFGGGAFRPSTVPYHSAGAGFTSDADVPTETVRGILDTMPEGHGFLRPKFTPSDGDVYISQSQIRRFLLRNGDMVEGQARPPKESERYFGLLKVEKVNELPAEEMEKRPKFEDLTPVYPNKLVSLETEQVPLSTRMIDLVAPIGFGQRGLIVSPPKAGKTTILKEIAAGITANYPKVHLMAALIGERPEEVTDLSRSIKGEVLASNFDQSPQEQTRIAEVTLDRAKRLVEMGRDVVVLLDSITRLARAYNLVVNPSGRTLSGGFDPAALYPAKRFLGAARCVEGGGSLTVIGTALVDTGSRMDDLIYEEFKGTGNMELTLSRILEERRVFPAIDVGKSGTRHDELLLGEDAMKKITTLRHMLSLLSDEERTMMLIERLGKTKTNAEFLESLAKG
ncbi:MAG: transcription termination factor Rho [Patescibacteria group bacterium]